MPRRKAERSCEAEEARGFRESIIRSTSAESVSKRICSVQERDLLSDGPLLAAVADGGGQCEAISALRASSVFPRPLTNMSASRGFRTVANEMNMTLLRAIYESDVSKHVAKLVTIRSTQIDLLVKMTSRIGSPNARRNKRKQTARRTLALPINSRTRGAALCSIESSTSVSGLALSLKLSSFCSSNRL